MNKYGPHIYYCNAAFTNRIAVFKQFEASVVAVVQLSEVAVHVTSIPLPAILSEPLIVTVHVDASVISLESTITFSIFSPLAIVLFERMAALPIKAVINKNAKMNVCFMVLSFFK